MLQIELEEVLRANRSEERFEYTLSESVKSINIDSTVGAEGINDKQGLHLKSLLESSHNNSKTDGRENPQSRPSSAESTKKKSTALLKYANNRYRVHIVTTIFGSKGTYIHVCAFSIDLMPLNRK